MNNYKLDSNSENLIVSRILMLAGFGFTTLGLATPEESGFPTEESDDEDPGIAAA